MSHSIDSIFVSERKKKNILGTIFILLLTNIKASFDNQIFFCLIWNEKLARTILWSHSKSSHWDKKADFLKPKINVIIFANVKVRVGAEKFNGFVYKALSFKLSFVLYQINAFNLGFPIRLITHQIAGSSTWP